MNTLHKTIAIALSAAVLAPSTNADSIRLRNSIRLETGQRELTLADIAVIDGVDAMRFADLIVANADDTGETFLISISDVRSQLEKGGVHWGRVNLSGRRVRVRAASPPTENAGPARPDAPAKPVLRDEEARSATDLIKEPTLRGAVARGLVKHLAVDPSDLRVRYMCADPTVLGRTTNEYQFQVRPDSGAHGDRMSFVVESWRGVTHVGTDRIALQPVIQATVATLRRSVERGDRLRPDDFELHEGWYTPAETMGPGSMDAINGKVARRRLREGERLRNTDLETEQLVRRGQIVKLRCHVGGVVIEMTATADAEGGLGDAIPVRKLRERTSLLAVVTGPGQVLIDYRRGDHASAESSS